MNQIAAKLSSICIIQQRVRDCEIEGMIFDLESKLGVFLDFDFITFEDYRHLMWILGHEV